MMYNDFPRNEFRIMFKDKVKGNGDWDIKLVTNEPLYGEDIIEMIVSPPIPQMMISSGK